VSVGQIDFFFFFYKGRFREKPLLPFEKITVQKHRSKKYGSRCSPWWSRGHSFFRILFFHWLAARCSDRYILKGYLQKDKRLNMNIYDRA